MDAKGATGDLFGAVASKKVRSFKGPVENDPIAAKISLDLRCKQNER